MSELLTTKDLCTMFNVSKTTIMSWRNNGLPYTKINGRVIRYRKEEVEKWINEKSKNVQ